MNTTEHVCDICCCNPDEDNHVLVIRDRFICEECLREDEEGALE